MRFQVRELKVARDEFGPEQVFEVYGPSNSRIIGWLVIDNTWRSPKGVGKGGTAMYEGCDLNITLKKARVMTFKQVFCSPIGEVSEFEPWGGAKGGINFDSSHPDAEKVLRGWARALHDAGILPNRYIFGLDVGLKEWASRAVCEELGDPKVSTGKPEEIGGIPYDELGLTGLGLMEALKVMCEYAGSGLGPKTAVVIQGFGAVGQGFAKWLDYFPVSERPVLQAVSDVNGAFVNRERNLSPWEIVRLANEFRSSLVNYGFERIQLGYELFMPCDVLVLAAKENQITSENVDRIKAKIILQGANLGVSVEAERILHEHRQLSLPDFVVNAGASCSVYVEHAGGAVDEAIKYIREVVSHNTRFILKEMEKQPDIPPRQIAQKIAQDMVRNAQAPKYTQKDIMP